MKKVICTSLIVLMFICLMITNVYAKSSAAIGLNTTKSEYEKEEEIVVEAELSELNTDIGVIALSAVLEYDKDNLEFIGISGENSWQVSYNPENGKIVTDRGEPVTHDEVVFKITFKVKKARAKKVNIALKEIEIGDGGDDGVSEVQDITKTISIKSQNGINIFIILAVAVVILIIIVGAILSYVKLYKEKNKE